MENERPDVEAIIAGIKKNIEEAGQNIPEPSLSNGDPESMEYNLRLLNIYVQSRGGGSNLFIRFIRRFVLRALGLSGFHENIAKVLNELAKNKPK